MSGTVYWEQVNPYQTRHTYASMMLSQGENIMWMSKQLGHVDVEMVMKTYGRWIPDHSLHSGYRPVHNWDAHLKTMDPLRCLYPQEGDVSLDKSNSYMVEAAGIEPASVNPTSSALHAYPNIFLFNVTQPIGRGHYNASL